MIFKIRVWLDISRGRGGKGADLHDFQDPSLAGYLKLVRGKGADFHDFQDPSLAGYLKLVRGKGADLHAFQDSSSAGYLKLVRGKGRRSSCFQDLSSTQDVQVGVLPTSTSVSPLSLWERARVRGF
jgi:hypothetical protein